MTNKIVTAAYSQFLKVIMVFCWVIFLIGHMIILKLFNFENGFSLFFWFVLINFLFVFFGGVYVLWIVFKKIQLESDGLIVYQLFSKPLQIKWNEIKCLRRPPNRFPYEIVYLNTFQGEQLSLGRGMKNYQQVADKIKEQSAKLESFDP